MLKDISHYPNIKEIPKVGDVIYVQTSLYLSHGEDDFQGGKAKIIKVEDGISGGHPAIYISINTRPGYSYNWQFLEEEQERLRKEFGNEWSHPDPDWD
jgi:hypothetical protein